MENFGRIIEVVPPRAIPGGEIELKLQGVRFEPGDSVVCRANGVEGRVTGASSRRVISVLPDLDDSTAVIQIESDPQISPKVIIAGKLLVNGMHIVANPAIDPSDDALILTRSGSRGQQLPTTLFRLETDGYLDELPVEILNPTGIAFSPTGKMYVTNRADGTVLRIDDKTEATVVERDLGTATGLVFDELGIMYVGDRAGMIYKVFERAGAEQFASIEPSVAAFHMALGPDEKLYVASPGFASNDAIYQVDKYSGRVNTFIRGLGRPQGLAFDRDGNLYVAACYRGRHGIVKIDINTKAIEQFVAGNGIVGLCFTRNGEMVVATNDSIYSLNVGVYGTLLPQN